MLPAALLLLAQTCSASQPFCDPSVPRPRVHIEDRRDIIARQEAERRHAEYLVNEFVDLWNEYALAMTNVMKALERGVVDYKSYKTAVTARRKLERHFLWPFKDKDLQEELEARERAKATRKNPPCEQ